MKREKSIICRDIKAEERNLRRLFPKPQKGQEISCSSFDYDYEYNIRRRAIFNTYTRNKYTLYQLNCRLGSLSLEKEVNLDVVLSFSLGIISSLIFQELLKLYHSIPDLSDFFGKFFKGKDSIWIFIFVNLVLALLYMIGLEIRVLARWIKRCLIALFSDRYYLEDYEIEIIKAQLSKLEKQSFQEFRNPF